MFNYAPELRKIMYTTNEIESLNSAFRKFIKVRTVYPTDEILFKSLYLAQDKITSKWNVPYANLGVIYSSLQIIFWRKSIEFIDNEYFYDNIIKNSNYMITQCNYYPYSTNEIWLYTKLFTGSNENSLISTFYIWLIQSFHLVSYLLL